MSVNAKVATYTCLFIIVLIFLALGFGSVNNVKSAKLNPKVFYTAQLVDCGSTLVVLSDRLYELLSKSCNLNPDSVVSIENDNGEVEKVTQSELVYQEIKKISSKVTKQQILLDKLSEKEGYTEFLKSIDYYYKATDVLNTTSEAILEDFKEEDNSKCLIPRYKEFIEILGNRNSRVKYYVNQARKYLHQDLY